MPEKIVLRQAVIVEGKYDKIRVEAVVDALVLATDGFRVFKDPQMRALIREMAMGPGIIVLTDSDAAGFKIRACLSDIARGGSVTQVYIPDIPGKERRKARPGKEGKLGVEGIDAALLRAAFEQAGLASAPQPEAGITRLDLYELGLTGGPDSGALRRRLLARLGLPARLSSGAMLQVLCRRVTRAELAGHVEALLQEGGQRK